MLWAGDTLLPYEKRRTAGFLAALRMTTTGGQQGVGRAADVVLCGGVMQNARLVGRLVEGLEGAGLRPHIHREVPPNDGGMSLGEAVVGRGRG